jgi:AraC-like DNA-binding protein
MADMKNIAQAATLRPNPARQLRAELAGKIASLIGNEENRITEIPGVSLHRRTAPTPPCRTTYQPGIIVVAQGSKQVNLGKSSFIYDEAHYLLTAVDLPIVSWVAEATQEVPCLVLSLKLDISMVRELLSREEIHVADAPSDSPAMSIGETTPEFMSACCRLLDLLNSPQDIPFLNDLIQREIIYRILRGPEGARLRSVATLGDQSHRTAKAIAWIAANYSKTLRVEELAELSSMGVSTLHHHFRMLTSMSPLQYQKQLRLQSARNLMLNNGMDAASAAFEVGYESPTQFNREYSRFFGQPPVRDVRALRESGTKVSEPMTQQIA